MVNWRNSLLCLQYSLFLRKALGHICQHKDTLVFFIDEIKLNNVNTFENKWKLNNKTKITGFVKSLWWIYSWEMALDIKSIHVLEFTLRKIWYAALPIFPNIDNYGYLF